MSEKPALSARDRVLTAVLAWCFDRLGPHARERVLDAMAVFYRRERKGKEGRR